MFSVLIIKTTLYGEFSYHSIATFIRNTSVIRDAFLTIHSSCPGPKRQGETNTTYTVLPSFQFCSNFAV